MDTLELKRIQEPIKEKYMQHPEAALITLHSQSKVGEGITCKVETGKMMVEAGLHPASGGDGMLACSGDMLLESLVACSGVTLSSVATSIGIKIKEGMVKAEGDLDFRGTMAVDKDTPVGFKSIRLSFYLNCDEDEDKIQTLLKLTKRYCVVYQTINSGTKINTGIENSRF